MVWAQQTDYVRATTNPTSWCKQKKQFMLELQPTLLHGVSRKPQIMLELQQPYLMVWAKQTDYVRATADATSWCGQNKQIMLKL